MTLPIPEAFNTAFGMGAPKGYYPIKNANRVGNLVAFFIFMGGAVLLFLYGLYDTYVAYQRHGPAVIDDHLVAPLVIAAILFGLGLLSGWGAYNNWNKGVAVYDNGFAARDRKGVRTWMWTDVISYSAAVTRHYTNGIYTGTTHVYTVFNKQNEKLSFADMYKGVEELGKAIENATFPARYERARQLYNSGQTVAFGPVAISKAGIVIGKKTYPWTEVKEVSIHQGILKVSKKDGGWFSGASASAPSIPNLRVLLSIIDQVVGVKAG